MYTQHITPLSSSKLHCTTLTGQETAPHYTRPYLAIPVDQNQSRRRSQKRSY